MSLPSLLAEYSRVPWWTVALVGGQGGPSLILGNQEEGCGLFGAGQAGQHPMALTLLRKRPLVHLAQPVTCSFSLFKPQAAFRLHK
jgi:hypothetical protein